MEWKERHNDSAIDGKLTVKLNNQKIELYAEIKKEPRALHFDKIEELAVIKNHFIVLAQIIFPKIKEKLRERKITYLGAKGDIYQ